MSPRFHVETYGCQMNVADSALVTRLLQDAGWELVEHPEDADCVLLNSCTVRDHAKKRIVGRLCTLTGLRGGGRRVILGLLGCLAQHERRTLIDELPFLDLAAGPDSYRRLPEMLTELWEGHGPQLDLRLRRSETYADLPPARSFGSGAAYVTVQRGCDQFCAYCVVPKVRGRERAVPAAAVMRQVDELVAAGFQELTLLGQTVNLYQDGDTGFAELLRRVARTPGLRRVRFLSPHPRGFSLELIAAIGEEPTVMPHVHLPVQSGADSVLEAMGRGYTVVDYLQLLASLRQVRPGVVLSTDLLVGFPGETEEHLQQTLALLEQARFTLAYMYRYSERPGTRAAHEMPDVIPEAVKLDRLARVIELQERITHEQLQGFVGQTVRVRVDRPARKDPADRLGMSDHNIPVVVRSLAPLDPGAFVSARVLESTGHTLVAEQLP